MTSRAPDTTASSPAAAGARWPIPRSKSSSPRTTRSEPFARWGSAAQSVAHAPDNRRARHRRRSLDAIDAALPQTQCTRCGYPDCRSYAQAIAAGEADINRCPPGGAEGVARLAALTGQALLPAGRRLRRRGTASRGVDRRECLHRLHACIDACPVDCIVGAAKQMHTVIESLCTGCELCLPACPVDCIALEDVTPGRSGWAAWSPRCRPARERYRMGQARRERERLERTDRLEAHRTLPVTEDGPAATPVLKAAARRSRPPACVPAPCATPAETSATPALLRSFRQLQLTGSGRMRPADIETFFATLAASNPEPATELAYSSVFELLAAVLLSAQATDVGVNKATRRLFVVAPTPQKMLALGIDGLTEHIRTIGLFRSKARHLMRDLPPADRTAWRRGAAHARGAGGAAGRGPQDGQRGAQRRLRRADHGGGHAHLPRRQPHRAGTGQDTAGGRAEAAASACPPAYLVRRPPLADPARPLRLPGAQAALQPMQRLGLLRLGAPKFP